MKPDYRRWINGKDIKNPSPLTPHPQAWWKHSLTEYESTLLKVMARGEREWFDVQSLESICPSPTSHLNVFQISAVSPGLEAFLNKFTLNNTLLYQDMVQTKAPETIQVLVGGSLYGISLSTKSKSETLSTCLFAYWERIIPNLPSGSIDPWEEEYTKGAWLSSVGKE